MCFSDESTFEILADKSTFVRRRPGEKYHPSCIVERVKHPVKIMVWSVISSKGVGRLQIVQGTMKQDQYKDIKKNGYCPNLGNGPLTVKTSFLCMILHLVIRPEALHRFWQKKIYGCCLGLGIPQT